MWTTTNPQPGWVRWTWAVKNTGQRPTVPPELSEIPGVIVRDVSPVTGFVEAHESTWGLRVFQQWFAEHSQGFMPYAPRYQLTQFFRSPTPEMWKSLFAHQRAAVHTLCASLTGCILADEMGLGKSRAAAVAALMRRADRGGPAGPVLICGPKFVRDVWRRELLTLGAIKDDSELVALEGVSADDDSFATAPFWFCHYDILDYWTNRMAWNRAARRPAVVIHDEAHAGKNPRSRRGKAMQRISGLTPFRLVLTGTPIANTPRDLYQLLVLVDGPKAWGSFHAFRVRYVGAVNEGHGFRDTGPTNSAELQQRLGGRYLARTKAEVGLDLPPLTRNVHQINISTRDAEHHDAVLRNSSVPLATLVRLIRAGTAGEDVLRILGQLRSITSAAKLPTTIELLDSLLEQGQSVVCFVHERKTAEKLVERVNGLHHEAVFVHGGQQQDSRDDIVRVFQSGAIPTALVATYGALKEGVTLTRAAHLIHHDLDWQPSVMLQSEARIHRIGQTRGAQTYWMVAKNSIDTLFVEAVLRKVTANAQTIGDGSALAARDALEGLDLARMVGISTLTEDAQKLLEAWR